MIQAGIKNAEDLLARDPYKVIEEILKIEEPLHCKFILASIAGGSCWSALAQGYKAN